MLAAVAERVCLCNGAYLTLEIKSVTRQHSMPVTKRADFEELRTNYFLQVEQERTYSTASTGSAYIPLEVIMTLDPCLI